MQRKREKRENIFSRLLINENPLFMTETVTEVIGNRRLTIQGLQDILHFTPEEIRLQTRSGIIRICGENLTVTILTQDSMELKGKILTLILSDIYTEGNACLEK